MAVKEFKILEGLSPEWQAVLGRVEEHFSMIVWGHSGNGKSSFVVALVKELMRLRPVLYCALEEGISATMQANLARHGVDGSQGKLLIANHEVGLPGLMAYLKKPRSPQVVVIDSLQYFHITYVDYKHLKEAFPHKAFIFISHASGKVPDGKTADKVRYDAAIKVWVEGYVAFVTSRYGGTANYIIWEQGALKKWGKRQLNKHRARS